ncbi:hypothetical protein PMIN04_010714 [Paraphaeosphaeria minitans]
MATHGDLPMRLLVALHQSGRQSINLCNRLESMTSVIIISEAALTVSLFIPSTDISVMHSVVRNLRAQATLSAVLMQHYSLRRGYGEANFWGQLAAFCRMNRGGSDQR